MKKTKRILIQIISILLITFNVSFSEDSCVPDGTGPCPDVCNPSCCNYDPDELSCVPINKSSNYLIYTGILLLGFVIYTYKKKIAVNPS